MKPAIEIKNLGKEYTLAGRQPYMSLREVFASSLKNVFDKGKKKKEKFWALQDIHLDIEQGERVGIIGRNGAGKSTLLKILSRIIPPSTGYATIRGRVGSLLEVGTGFHPELSGAENIYLNGSILGLKKKEIGSQFDAIVDFSGVEKFIETPLKHYSSGMQMRLAFSVASHLDSEILLIDEVLAVGDAEFQKKCIRKMEEVSTKEGRTIVFVSHQLNSIVKLCTNAVWIDNGKLKYSGSAQDAVGQYTSSVQTGLFHSTYKNDTQTGESYFDSIGLEKPIINIGEDLDIRINYTKNYLGRQLVININIRDEFGEMVSHIINGDDDFSTANLSGHCLHVTLKSLNLVPGKYFLSFWAGLDMHHGIDTIENAVAFEISEQNTYTERVTAFPRSSKTIIRSVWQGD